MSVTENGTTSSYSYDVIGNLLNDGTLSYTWQKGRQLTGISGDGLTASYSYDASGIRTAKTFDVISLGASIVEVTVNPTDPWAWASLAGNTIDLIPFVSGVDEATRAVKAANKAANKAAETVLVKKATDFNKDAAELVKSLERIKNCTKLLAGTGVKIHNGYKVVRGFKRNFTEYSLIRGFRPDYIDFDRKIIYELKPMNPGSARRGVKQLIRHNKTFGSGFTLVLELY